VSIKLYVYIIFSQTLKSRELLKHLFDILHIHVFTENISA